MSNVPIYVTLEKSDGETIEFEASDVTVENHVTTETRPPHIQATEQRIVRTDVYIEEE